MTGSTLYRRLPDGTWAAEREDQRQASSAPVPLAAAVPPPVGVGAAAGVGVAAAAMAGGGGAPPAAPSPGYAAQSIPAAPSGAPPGAAPGTQPTTVRTVKRRRGPVRTGLRILKWAAIAYAIWLVVLGVYATRSLDKIEALSPAPIEDTPGTVWLLVGSDSREDLSAEEQSDLHTGDEEGQRTDTIMLVHMRAGATEPTLVSIPRDSWVTIPAHTATDGTEVGDQHSKINAAFSYGGAPLLTQTIEYNTGLHVDHYMEVGMGGIVSLTDAVGGVEVCFDEAIVDENSGLDVEAGCQVLDGRTALAWVRMRYADPTGDLGRMERQQQWLRLVMGEALSWGTVLNPVKQWQLVTAATGSVKVDQDSGIFALGRLGLGMGRVAQGAGEVTTVPTSDTDHWENGQWVLKWDSAEANELFGSMGGSTPQAPVETQ